MQQANHGAQRKIKENRQSATSLYLVCLLPPIVPPNALRPGLGPPLRFLSFRPSPGAHLLLPCCFNFAFFFFFMKLFCHDETK
jgi:hypothetical protein